MSTDIFMDVIENSSAESPDKHLQVRWRRVAMEFGSQPHAVCFPAFALCLRHYSPNSSSDSLCLFSPVAPPPPFMLLSSLYSSWCRPCTLSATCLLSYMQHQSVSTSSIYKQEKHTTHTSMAINCFFGWWSTMFRCTFGIKHKEQRYRTHKILLRSLFFISCPQDKLFPQDIYGMLCPLLLLFTLHLLTFLWISDADHIVNNPV